jgi:acyl carrier protein
VLNEQVVSPPPTEWPKLGDPTHLERILSVIATEAKIDPALVTPEATLETLGIQSMDVVMILMAIEEQLDAYIPMSAELSAARNLSEFVAAIDTAVEKSAASGGERSAS